MIWCQNEISALTIRGHCVDFALGQGGDLHSTCGLVQIIALTYCKITPFPLIVHVQILKLYTQLHV